MASKMEASQKSNKFFFKKKDKSILHGYLTKVRVEKYLKRK